MFFAGPFAPVRGHCSGPYSPVNRVQRGYPTAEPRMVRNFSIDHGKTGAGERVYGEQERCGAKPMLRRTSQRLPTRGTGP